MDLGCGISSFLSHSLTHRYVFVDEECVYKISINKMKDMEKWDEELGYSLRKNSLFIQRIGFTLLAPLGFLGYGQYLSEAFCHASQLCVCTGKRTVVGTFSKIRRSCSSRPIHPLRSQDGCEVHVCTFK